ncbi:MAG: ABC transporter substrate-binding protein, partial [Aquihabitans sp.]
HRHGLKLCSVVPRFWRMLNKGKYMSNRNRRPHRGRVAAGAVLLSLSLVATACGGSSGKDKANPNESPSTVRKDLKLTAQDGESGLKDAGDPKRGGTLTYGLEADSEGGFCLAEAQLAISGMMVVRAVYDTLTMPNAAGDYVPYLAKSIEHSDDYKTWTIGLRDGIKFHDGTDLNATVVKNNIDAYRGKDPKHPSLLFAFVLDNIDTVTATDALTVTVTTKVPWVAFPAYLYSSSRMGMMAQAQLDSPNCGTELVGTGPFKFVSWTKNQKFVAKRNADYWQIAPDGKSYPYADGIEFRPITSSVVRNQTLESGGINIMHSSNADDIKNKLRKLRDSDKANMFVSEMAGEVSFVQLNNTKAPFDDIRIRRALAMGADRSDVNDRINDGLPTVAEGPFAPGSVGYLKDSGFPKYDLAESKKLVAEYEADGNKIGDITLSITTDPSVVQTAELIQQRAKAAGITIKIRKLQQAALITAAIAKDYQAMVFRNYPGGDPDQNYVWWYGTQAGAETPSLTNFSGFNDPEVNKLLDEGRSEPDPAKRKTIYQNVNRRMANQVFNVWAWYTPWSIVTASNVHGILGPPLPGSDTSKPGPKSTSDAAEQPSLGLATGHSLLGLWVAS